MNEPFQITSGVPIPAIPRFFRTKYPFPAMKVGDSFFAPAPDATVKRIGMAAYCFARELRTKTLGADCRKFHCRAVTEPAGVRCWRIL